MAKEMTQEEREKFFEEPKGMLGKAVSDERWDMAMGKVLSPFNKDATLEDVLAYARANQKTVMVTATPTYMSVYESDYEEGDDDGES